GVSLGRRTPIRAHRHPSRSRAGSACLMPIRQASIVLSALALAGCASLPPGSSYPRTASKAFEHPEETRLGQAARARTAGHVDTSGFRLLSVGIDGFL